VGEVEAGVGEHAVEGGAKVGGCVRQPGGDRRQKRLLFAGSGLYGVAVGAFGEEFLREAEGLVAESVGLDGEGVVFAHEISSFKGYFEARGPRPAPHSRLEVCRPPDVTGGAFDLSLRRGATTLTLTLSLPKGEGTR